MSNLYGLVTKIELVDSEGDQLHGIEVAIKTSTGSSLTTEIVYPLDVNIKRVPVVGEQVYLVKGKSSDSKTSGGGRRYFYITSNSLQHNINHNVLPKSIVQSTGGGGTGGYAEAAAGNPDANNEKDFEFEAGFDEVPDLSGLQPFSGDVLIEGRYGQSMRLGHTPSGAGTTKDPSWLGSPTKPITIIRNHQEEGGWNKFVIEDVDKDDSSIYMTSGQTIKLTQAHSYSIGVQAANVYSNTQVLINSGRVVLNARDERVVIAGSSDVNISTPVWKAAMDNMFTQIDEIKNELNNLNTAVSAFSSKAISNTMTDNKGGTGVNIPISSGGAKLKADTAGIKARIAKITTELNLMKQ